MADTPSPYADIVPGGAPKASSPYADILPGAPAAQPDVTPAAEGQPAKVTVRPQPAASILGFPEHYTQIRQEAQNQVGEGVKQIKEGLTTSSDENRALESAIEGIQQGKDIDYAVEQAASPHSMPVPGPGMKVAAGVGNVAAGGAGYALSGLSAAVRSILSAPLEQRTGIPKEYTEFAANLAIPLPKAASLPGRAEKTAAPTVQELRAESSRLYKSPEVAGTSIRPEALPQLAQTIKAELNAARANDVTAPQVFKLLDKAEAMPPGATSVTVDNLESLRQMLGDVAAPIRDGTGKVINGPEIRAAGIARGKIDAFLDTLPQDALLTGDSKAASATLKEARANHSAAESADNINRKQFRAELRAAVANSGMNVSNTMRSRIADILLNPAERRGYSMAELSLMDRIVRGTKPENAIRGASNILGGGGGAHAFYSGVMTAGVGPAIGFGLKLASNSMTAKNIDRLNEMVRGDSPLGRKMAAPIGNYGEAASAAAGNPTPENIARLTLASRNLSTNLRDVGIEVAPDSLFRLPGPMGAGAEENEQ